MLIHLPYKMYYLQERDHISVLYFPISVNTGTFQSMNHVCVYIYIFSFGWRCLHGCYLFYHFASFPICVCMCKYLWICLQVCVHVCTRMCMHTHLEALTGARSWEYEPLGLLFLACSVFKIGQNKELDCLKIVYIT